MAGIVSKISVSAPAIRWVLWGHTTGISALRATQATEHRNYFWNPLLLGTRRSATGEPSQRPWRKLTRPSFLVVSKVANGMVTIVILKRLQLEALGSFMSSMLYLKGNNHYPLEDRFKCIQDMKSRNTLNYIKRKGIILVGILEYSDLFRKVVNNSQRPEKNWKLVPHSFHI